MDLLSIENVSKSWGGNRAVNEMSFSLEKDTMGLIGPNGAGKTTLLSAIAGVTYPDSGKIIFEGREITRMKIWKRVGLGLVKTFQIVRPFRTLTVRESLELFQSVAKNRDVDGILKIMGIEDFAERKAFELSHGNLKRLEVAKVLITKPKLLLLDEPIGGLSASEAQNLIEALSGLKKKGMKMVIVEHRLAEIFTFTDEVIAMDKGNKIFQGTTEELFDNAKVREVYMGGEPNVEH